MVTTQTFSPRQFAQALGVSESSIKRWIDSGLITVSKTAGGHRRIPLHAVVRFVREQRMELLQPELLGLPGRAGHAAYADPTDLSGEILFETLTSERADQAPSMLLNAYLAGVPVTELLDGPVQQALVQIGALWRHDSDGIFAEHRGTQLIIQALSQLRALLPAADPESPAAVGCAPSRDPYIIPSLMADLTVIAAGYRSTNLGADTPTEALLQAARRLEPRVIWISVTGRPDREGVAALIAQLLDTVPGGHVLVGGRQSHKIDLPAHDRVARLQSMAELRTQAEHLRVTG